MKKRVLTLLTAAAVLSTSVYASFLYKINLIYGKIK